MVGEGVTLGLSVGVREAVGLCVTVALGKTVGLNVGVAVPEDVAVGRGGVIAVTSVGDGVAVVITEGIST